MNALIAMFGLGAIEMTDDLKLMKAAQKYMADILELNTKNPKKDWLLEATRVKVDGFAEELYALKTPESKYSDVFVIFKDKEKQYAPIEKLQIVSRTDGGQ